KLETSKPTLIEVKTVIGYGAPTKAGSSASHGAPLGEKEANGAKEHYEWAEEPFTVPAEVRDYLRNYKARGEKLEGAWNTMLANYKKEFPELASQLDRVLAGEVAADW
ncbi:transketolase, partial [Listeria monocytogenes]|nr:transketolase [Listeria monocytogenes]